MLKSEKIKILETLLSLSINHTEIVDDMAKTDQTYVVLDVRNAPDFVKKDQIKGAVAIPAKILASKVDSLDKRKTYVVYDWTAGTTLGKEALHILLSAGFEAYELSCALEGWKGMNLPIEQIVQ